MAWADIMKKRRSADPSYQYHSHDEMKEDWYGTDEGAGLFADLRFPHDLNDKHYLLLTWFPSKYHPGSFVRYTRAAQYIQLPVPINLVDSLNAQYNEIEMGTLGGAAVEKLSNTNVEALPGEIAKMGKDVIGGIYGAGSSVGGAIVDTMTGGKEGVDALRELITQGQAHEGAGALLSTFRQGQNALGVGLNRFFGGAPNPYVTAMFRGVGLKTHNFSWKLAPANLEESKTLTHIVRSLKARMLPARSKMGMNLEFPDDCYISIGSSLHLDQMYNFKRAVLRNCTVNYAPDGTPSFFAAPGADGGHPTAITITLDFLETEINTVDDFGGSARGSITVQDRIEQ